ncbi:DoxX family protein [Capnocytophaga sp. ARDL2]|uniref:DoxX family protein n=1 Tax=Capnocytophaga sp. ARDL2 TaxID=3238809 RepID=UPI003557684F
MKEILFPFTFVLFIMITYGFSFFEKIFNFSDTLGWMKVHFEKTPIKSLIPIGLVVLLIGELITFLLSIYAFHSLFYFDQNDSIEWMMVANIFCLLLMLIGQRFAKDFDGARTIVIYLIPSLLAMIYL